MIEIPAPANASAVWSTTASVDVAQAVGVADRNQALHAQGLGARGNALKLGDADIAGFMQVDIDFNAMPLSDAEDDIQLGVSVAVQGGGVDAANHLSPFADSGLHDLGGARAGDHAGLGEGHQLDVEQVFPVVPGFEHGVQVTQAGGGVHVHMATHGQGAVRSCLSHQRVGALDDGRCARQLTFFHGQALAQAGDRLVRAPAITHEALVQVNVAINETRQYQQAFQVDRFAGRGAGALRANVADAAVADSNVQGQAIGIDGIDELTVVHGTGLFYWGLVACHGKADERLPPINYQDQGQWNCGCGAASAGRRGSLCGPPGGAFQPGRLHRLGAPRGYSYCKVFGLRSSGNCCRAASSCATDWAS